MHVTNGSRECHFRLCAVCMSTIAIAALKKGNVTVGVSSHHVPELFTYKRHSIRVKVHGHADLHDPMPSGSTKPNYINSRTLGSLEWLYRSRSVAVNFRIGLLSARRSRPEGRSIPHWQHHANHCMCFIARQVWLTAYLGNFP